LAGFLHGFTTEKAFIEMAGGQGGVAWVHFVITLAPSPFIPAGFSIRFYFMLLGAAVMHRHD
jgi:hypothetical protein